MVELGAACLIAAPFACAYAAIAALIGASRDDRRLVESSRRAVYALCALLTVAVVVLEAAFVRSDFSVALVADHSSTTTPLGCGRDTFRLEVDVEVSWYSVEGAIALVVYAAPHEVVRAVSTPEMEGAIPME